MHIKRGGSHDRNREEKEAPDFVGVRSPGLWWGILLQDPFFETLFSSLVRRSLSICRDWQMYQKQGECWCENGQMSKTFWINLAGAEALGEDLWKIQHWERFGIIQDENFRSAFSQGKGLSNLTIWFVICPNSSHGWLTKAWFRSRTFEREK